MMSERLPINEDSSTMDNYGTVEHPEHEETIGIPPGGDEGAAPFVDDDVSSGSQERTEKTLSKDSYFKDGKRKIDFVLVYDENKEKKSDTVDPKLKSGKTKLTSREKKTITRETFMTNLKQTGLEMEEDVIESEKKIMHYIKIHAPWDVLCFYAEDLCMRAPLQAHSTPNINWSERILSKLHLPNFMAEDVPNKPLDYYSCQFKKSKMSRFLGGDNRQTFFLNKDRQRIVYEILATTAYGKRQKAEIGIERLLENSVYLGAFPLHEGPYQTSDTSKPAENMNPRQILYEYWARWGKWYKYQPLDHIREYFGEQIGIYFAWLGFYTVWLIPAAMVGLVVFLYGVLTMNSNTVAQETCESGRQFKMCPLCDEKDGCPYWYLSSVCMYTTLSYLFDQPGTLFFSVFVSFWAVTFLEYWKRRSASISHHWDCMDFQEEEEPPRPTYAATAPAIEKNPITGVNEPYFPKNLRLPRLFIGMTIIVIMIAIVIICILGVILYRVVVSIPLFKSAMLNKHATNIASLSAAFVNLLIIMALGRVYKKLAIILTQWEMHRTQTEFDNNLIFKVFIFQFVNFYSSIIYIGFFKGKFAGYPGHYTRMFGLRSEECQNGGCLIELAMLLAVIMIGKQAINNVQELVIPKIKTYLHRRHILVPLKSAPAETPSVKSRWEEDFELIENEGLFDEYLEMVLQFGFITIFVAAFPLAPLFALLNNWLEIRLDAHKFVCETRRPVAERSQDIGVWFTILDALAQLAVISNAILISFTSEFLPKLLYAYTVSPDRSLKGYVNYTLAWAPNGTLSQPCRYQQFRDSDGEYTMFYWQLLVIRLAFVIVFEHVVFFICRIIDILVPDVPESLAIMIKRERYLGKQALADTDTIMKMAQRDDDDDDDTTVSVDVTASDSKA